MLRILQGFLPGVSPSEFIAVVSSIYCIVLFLTSPLRDMLNTLWGDQIIKLRLSAMLTLERRSIISNVTRNLGLRGANKNREITFRRVVP